MCQPSHRQLPHLDPRRGGRPVRRSPSCAVRLRGAPRRLRGAPRGGAARGAAAADAATLGAQRTVVHRDQPLGATCGARVARGAWGLKEGA